MSTHALQALSIAHCTDSEDLPLRPVGALNRQGASQIGDNQLGDVKSVRGVRGVSQFSDSHINRQTTFSAPTSRI